MTEQAHEQSRAIWDEMATGWDRYSQYIWDESKHVAEWLVDRLDPQPGQVILDVAGGTGDIGMLAAERLDASGKVIETDFAQEMVDVAARRARERGLTNLENRTLDAQAMDLEDESVDGVLCRWGFMLMIQPDVALRECRRILKPDGKLAFSVWGKPEDNPWVTLPGMTMTQLGHPPGGDPFGPGGMFSMSDHDRIRSMVKDAGFSDVEIEEMPVVWSYSSFEEAWAFMTEVAGAIAALVKKLPPEEVERFKMELEKNLAPYIDSDGLKTPGVTINVLAT